MSDTMSLSTFCGAVGLFPIDFKNAEGLKKASWKRGKG